MLYPMEERHGWFTTLGELLKWGSGVSHFRVRKHCSSTCDLVCVRDSMSDPHCNLTSNKNSHCWFVTLDTPPADLHLTKTHCEAPKVDKTYSRALGVKQFVLVQQLLNDLYISVFTKFISGVWCLQTWAYQRVFNWPTLGICVDFNFFTHQIEVCTQKTWSLIYILHCLFLFSNILYIAYSERYRWIE